MPTSSPFKVNYEEKLRNYNFQFLVQPLLSNFINQWQDLSFISLEQMYEHKQFQLYSRLKQFLCSHHHPSPTRPLFRWLFPLKLQKVFRIFSSLIGYYNLSHLYQSKVAYRKSSHFYPHSEGIECNVCRHRPLLKVIYVIIIFKMNIIVRYWIPDNEIKGFTGSPVSVTCDAYSLKYLYFWIIKLSLKSYYQKYCKQLSKYCQQYSKCY